MTSACPAVELRGLRKSFGAVTAVDGLDLTIHPGEVVAFLGPNGAGKTTTIDMLLGLARPDAGEVRLLGGTPAEAVRCGRVAAVMQCGGLLTDLTGSFDTVVQEVEAESLAEWEQMRSRLFQTTAFRESFGAMQALVVSGRNELWTVEAER